MTNQDEARVSRVTEAEAADNAATMTKLMRRAAEDGRNGLPLPPATQHALEQRGLIAVRGPGRWNWTELGRRTLRLVQEEALNAE